MKNKSIINMSSNQAPIILNGKLMGSVICKMPSCVNIIYLHDIFAINFIARQKFATLRTRQVDNRSYSRLISSVDNIFGGLSHIGTWRSLKL